MNQQKSHIQLCKADWMPTLNVWAISWASVYSANKGFTDWKWTAFQARVCSASLCLSREWEGLLELPVMVECAWAVFSEVMPMALDFSISCLLEAASFSGLTFFTCVVQNHIIDLGEYTDPLIPIFWHKFSSFFIQKALRLMWRLQGEMHTRHTSLGVCRGRETLVALLHTVHLQSGQSAVQNPHLGATDAGWDSLGKTTALDSWRQIRNRASWIKVSLFRGQDGFW